MEFFSSDKSKCRIILNSDGSLAIVPTGNNSGDNVVLNEVSSSRTVWILEPVIMPYDKELSKLNFTYPLKNAANMYQINSDYGNRPKNGQVDHHEGIDIYATTGTPVYSPYLGTVVSEVQAKDIVNSSTDNRGSYIVICIDGEFLINSEPVHLYVIFMHLRENSPYNVSVGDTVNAGDLVAFSGNTGGVPAHLHMEVLFLGKEVFDPDTFDSTNFDPKNPPYQFYSRFNNTIDPIFFYQSINFTDI